MNGAVLSRVRTTLCVAVFGLGLWPVAAFSMRHYLPLVDNDEIGYFLQVKTFITEGFHGGYFFINDQIPRSHVHFGLHGPVFIVIYGLVAKVLGLRNDTFYVVNIALFAASMASLLYVLRQHVRRQIAVAGFVLVHGYFFLFLPSMLQESFHLALAVFIAAAWTRALESTSASAWAIAIGLVIVGMLTRYTWAFALPPLLFTLGQQTLGASARRWRVGAKLAIASVLMSAAALFVVLRLWAYWSAPATITPETIYNSPNLFRPDWSAAIRNTESFFRAPILRAVSPYTVWFRAELAALIVSGIAFAVAGAPGRRNAALTFLPLVVAPIVAQIMYYDVDGYRDLRILAAFDALAGLMFLSTVDVCDSIASRWTLAASASALVGVALVGAWCTLETTRVYGTNWRRSEAVAIDRRAEQTFDAMAPNMVVVPDATSFCKTAYTPLDVFADPRIIHLPPGVSVSLLLEATPGRIPRLRGKYVILHNEPSDWRDRFDASRDWRVVNDYGTFRLYRSTAACMDHDRL